MCPENPLLPGDDRRGALRIALAADHAGWKLKEALRHWLEERGFDVIDFGAHEETSSDYPDFGLPAAEAVSRKECARGILVCGTGTGMCITANKIPGIRAALCYDERVAELSRRHNDANVLCLGARFTPAETFFKIVARWLETGYEGGRHERRLGKIANYEKKRDSAKSDSP